MGDHLTDAAFDGTAAPRGRTPPRRGGSTFFAACARALSRAPRRATPRRRLPSSLLPPTDRRRLARRRPERARAARLVRREGEKLGLVEGREVGFAKGFEVGQEMGFYAGCHAVWARCVAEDPRLHRREAGRRDAVGSAVRAFPIDDALNEEILDILNAVRGKFKTVVALLGMHHEYNPKRESWGCPSDEDADERPPEASGERERERERTTRESRRPAADGSFWTPATAEGGLSRGASRLKVHARVTCYFSSLSDAVDTVVLRPGRPPPGAALYFRLCANDASPSASPTASPRSLTLPPSSLSSGLRPVEREPGARRDDEEVHGRHADVRGAQDALLDVRRDVEDDAEEAEADAPSRSRTRSCRGRGARTSPGSGRGLGGGARARRRRRRGAWPRCLSSRRGRPSRATGGESRRSPPAASPPSRSPTPRASRRFFPERRDVPRIRRPERTRRRGGKARRRGRRGGRAVTPARCVPAPTGEVPAPCVRPMDNLNAPRR